MSRRRRKLNKNEPYITLALLVGLALLTVGFGQQDGSSFRISQAITILLAVLFIVGLGLSAFVYWQEHTKRKAFLALDEAQIQTMGGVDFERYVGELLRCQGYRVNFTKVSGDYGVDIVAKKDGARVAVQVKRYKTVLGQDAVRQAVAGRAHYRCDQSMVVTNSTFTASAMALAKSNSCLLVDAEKLGRWIIAYQQN